QKTLAGGGFGGCERVSVCNAAARPAVGHDKHRSRAVAAELVGAVFKACAMESEILQEAAIADRDLALTDFSGDALAGNRAEFAYGIGLYAALCCGGDHRGSKRMFAP